MKQVQILNSTHPFEESLTAGYCSSFFCRLKGLMFRRGIPVDWGLLLVQSSESIVNAAIHMVAVPFDLGVIWINNAGKVVDKTVAKAWIGVKSPKMPARFILEVQPVHMDKFQVGDKIEFK
ncbi:MAG: DUF192 domain-containing protein [Anaerolineales bacterium]